MPEYDASQLPAGKNRKESIIKALSEEWPLPARSIHQRLLRETGTPTTYQATHKLLKQMLSEGILEKEGREYRIRQAWVEGLKKNTEQISESFKKKQPELRLESLKEGQSVKLSFKGIPDIGWFLASKAMQAPNPEKKTGLALWKFCYSIVGLESRHLNALKEALRKNKWEFVIEEKNEVDKMFAETLKQYGAKNFRFGVKCATPLSDKIVLGNFIFEMTYPSWFRKLWSLQNRLPKKIIQFNLARHFLLMRELQPTIHLTATKDRQLAEEYREEYLNLRIENFD